VFHSRPSIKNCRELFKNTAIVGIWTNHWDGDVNFRTSVVQAHLLKLMKRFGEDEMNQFKKKADKSFQFEWSNQK